MPEGSTLTIHLPTSTRDGLASLAERTQRSSDGLAAEAIADYVARELATIEAIERGRAQARAGQVIPHDEVMREVHAVIEAARNR